MLSAKSNKKPKIIYLLLLFTVIIVWGIDPVVNKLQYENYSPLALSILSTIFSSVMFFILSLKKLKTVNKRFFKIAIPIGALNSLACILQRVGLQLTTPSSYAFLEHLSCAFVPIAIFLFTKKRPSVLQTASIVICLIGCFLISGLTSGNASFSVGDLLCAIAGATLGFCIALVGIYAKEFDITAFTFVQMLLYFLISLIGAFVLDSVKLNGAPFEEFRFSLNPVHLIFAVLFGLFSVGFCWLLRNLAIANLNPIFVAVISPLSAVISSVVSIALQIESLTLNLIIGGVLISLAVVFSGLADTVPQNKNN